MLGATGARPFTAVTRCHFMDGCVELNTDFGSGVLADESRNNSGLTYATLGIDLIFGQVTVFECIAMDVCVC